MAAFRPFTIAEYHKLIETGILTDEDQVELLEGHLVLKMPRNPPHDSAISKLFRRLDRLAPPRMGGPAPGGRDVQHERTGAGLRRHPRRGG
jgi:hypothetical protein